VVAAIVALVALAGIGVYRRYLWVRGDYITLSPIGLSIYRFDFQPYSRWPLLQFQSVGGRGGAIYHPTWSTAWGHHAGIAGIPGLTGSPAAYRSMYQEPGAGHYIDFDNHATIQGTWRFPVGMLEGLGGTMNILEDPQLPVILGANERRMETSGIGLYLLHRLAARRREWVKAEDFRRRLDRIEEVPFVRQELAAMMDHDRLAFSEEESDRRDVWTGMIPALSQNWASGDDREQLTEAWWKLLQASARQTERPVFPTFSESRLVWGVRYSQAVTNEMIHRLQVEINSGEPERARAAFRMVLAPSVYGRAPIRGRLVFEKSLFSIRSWVLEEVIVTNSWSAEEIARWWQEFDPAMVQVVHELTINGEATSARELQEYWTTKVGGLPSNWHKPTSAPMPPGFFDRTKSVAEFQLLRLAFQCLHHKAVLGAWPDPDDAGAMQLTNLETESQPSDPYAGEAPLRAIRRGDKFVLYSVGPDGVDQRGAGDDVTFLPEL